ncbi:uncharacterized protein LOC142762733 [Rhipicephalus microplus]|uniref:uncharacterized protein LOC142762733 n=1 Tax=Rhipicephalus microplus TaxID=6941 RepID=UPI003F6B05FA
MRHKFANDWIPNSWFSQCLMLHHPTQENHPTTMRKQETMIGILLFIPAGYVGPNLPEARSLAQLPSQPGFSATSAEFSTLEMSPLDNQHRTASATTRAAHWDLEMAPGPDKERINSGGHHMGAIGRGDTVGMWPNPFI